MSHAAPRLREANENLRRAKLSGDDFKGFFKYVVPTLARAFLLVKQCWKVKFSINQVNTAVPYAVLETVKIDEYKLQNSFCWQQPQFPHNNFVRSLPPERKTRYLYLIVCSPSKARLKAADFVIF